MARDDDELTALGAQGQRLRRLRERKLVSQEAAAHAVGVSVRAYREWEAGRNGISAENLPKLLLYFETTDSYLRYGREVEWPDLPTESAQDILAQIGRNTAQLGRNTARLDRIEVALGEMAESLAVVRDVTEALAAARVSEASREPAGRDSQQAQGQEP